MPNLVCLFIAHGYAQRHDFTQGVGAAHGQQLEQGMGRVAERRKSASRGLRPDYSAAAATAANGGGQTAQGTDQHWQAHFGKSHAAAGQRHGVGLVVFGC